MDHPAARPMSASAQILRFPARSPAPLRRWTASSWPFGRAVVPTSIDLRLQAARVLATTARYWFARD
ncbi:hypothetical protein ACFPPF_10250 [Xenophilus aerolatus]|jgi:hypothetical protein|nr:hypothetical protein [Xenophilus aerolatus]